MPTLLRRALAPTVPSNASTPASPRLGRTRAPRSPPGRRRPPCERRSDHRSWPISTRTGSRPPGRTPPAAASSTALASRESTETRRWSTAGSSSCDATQRIDGSSTSWLAITIRRTPTERITRACAGRGRVRPQAPADELAIPELRGHRGLAVRSQFTPCARQKPAMRSRLCSSARCSKDHGRQGEVAAATTRALRTDPARMARRGGGCPSCVRPTNRADTSKTSGG